MEDALGSSIMVIGFGAIGAPICGVPGIIGIVNAGDMAAETPICEPGATGMPICEGDVIDMPKGNPIAGAGNPSN